MALLGLCVAGDAVGPRRPPAPAPAAPAATTAHGRRRPKIDTGDTAWVLMSSALVLLMTAPGLALFYGGMVRQKNALGTLMQSFIILALISIQWVLWGYTLAFGPDKGGIIGGLEWAGPARGVGQSPNPDVRRDHSAPGLHALPDDVRRHHAGAHHRAPSPSGRSSRPSSSSSWRGPPSSTTRSPTGSGATGAGSATWARSTSPGGTVVHISSGRLRPRRGARHRQAQGLRAAAHAAAQPAVDRARREPALVRLVRLQRGQRARRQRPGRPRLRRPPTPRRPRRRSPGCSRSGARAASRRCSGAASGAVAGLVASRRPPAS